MHILGLLVAGHNEIPRNEKAPQLQLKKSINKTEFFSKFQRMIDHKKSLTQPEENSLSNINEQER